MGDRLLIIIDVQQGFVNEWTRHIHDAAARLQHRFEPVFVTRFENPEGSPFRAFKALERFAPGSPETALAFGPKANARHIVKNSYSAATPEVLAAACRAGGAAYLCGIATDNCVLATALDLFAAGLHRSFSASALRSTSVRYGPS